MRYKPATNKLAVTMEEGNNANPKQPSASAEKADVTDTPDLPVVKVTKKNMEVIVDVSNETPFFAPHDRRYDGEPYCFTVFDSKGGEPFLKIFASLVYCHGGTLIFNEHRYRIQSEEVHVGPPPMKKVRPSPALQATKIQQGETAEIQVQKIEILSPTKRKRSNTTGGTTWRSCLLNL